MEMLIFHQIFLEYDNILSFLSRLHFQYRFSLILHFAILNIKIRYINTHFGLVWAFLEPLAYFLVLYVVFTTIRTRETDFAIYLITGVMFFHIFARGTSGGLISLVTNTGIMQSVNIKRIFFPIVSTVSVGILAFIDIGVFFGVMPIFQFVPSWTIVLLPIPLILLLVLIMGLSFLLSIVNVYVKDIKNLWSIVIHTLLFVSPIFWKPENIDGVLLLIHKINPLGQLIDISHKLVIDGQIPPISDWVYTTLIICGIFALGYFMFNRLQDKIVEDL